MTTDTLPLENDVAATETRPALPRPPAIRPTKVKDSLSPWAAHGECEQIRLKG